MPPKDYNPFTSLIHSKKCLPDEKNWVGRHYSPLSEDKRPMSGLYHRNKYQRAIIELMADMNDYTAAEVAEVTGFDVDSVRSSMKLLSPRLLIAEKKIDKTRAYKGEQLIYVLRKDWEAILKADLDD
jgi:predicted transcriptional regulator